jgi:hypothetical protein
MGGGGGVPSLALERTSHPILSTLLTSSQGKEERTNLWPRHSILWVPAPRLRSRHLPPLTPCTSVDAFSPPPTLLKTWPHRLPCCPRSCSTKRPASQMRPRFLCVGGTASRRWRRGCVGERVRGPASCRAGARGALGGVPARAPGRAKEARGTHPLLLPAADGHRGGGRGAVPELGRLPRSQQAPGEPAGPLAGHRRPRCSGRGAGACVPPVLRAPASSTHPPFRKRNSEPFPPSSSLNSQEAGFSLLHPHSSHPLPSAEAWRRLSKLCATPRERGQLAGPPPAPRRWRIWSRSHYKDGGRWGGGAAPDRATHPGSAGPSGLLLWAMAGLGGGRGAATAGLRAGQGLAKDGIPHLGCEWRVGTLAAFAG